MNPSSTTLTKPVKKIKTKGRPCKVDTSTRRLPSAFEIVEAFSSHDSQAQPSKKKLRGRPRKLKVPVCPYLYSCAQFYAIRPPLRINIRDSFLRFICIRTLLDEHARYGPSYSFMLSCSGDFFYPFLECLSFLPLYVLGDDEATNLPKIAIGLVNDNHFIQVVVIFNGAFLHYIATFPWEDVDMNMGYNMSTLGSILRFKK
ncbi:hypothetical protein DVH24_039884 [Malus domestica]|uniref:Uncharacterized protein n=1 Tax=Malus domestica TaxID=3750 RepID=A0A498I9W8_MALDO|nr:hypothetical protein DVH24_039884 [Malus domestica]